MIHGTSAAKRIIDGKERTHFRQLFRTLTKGCTRVPVSLRNPIHPVKLYTKRKPSCYPHRPIITKPNQTNEYNKIPNPRLTLPIS